jgi:peroxiredoxin
MTAWRRVLAACAVAAMLATAALGRAADPVVPATLRDVAGRTVDVAALARTGKLVFVTLKRADCPVCRTQLRRLGRLLPALRACGAEFIVVGRARDAELAAVARDTSFPFPFVTEGAGAIAAAAGFATGGDELIPGFFAVDAERRLVWAQRGRSAGAFGDRELAAWLRCPEASPDLMASR